jgi:serine/threonine-protein kinase RsbW
VSTLRKKPSAHRGGIDDAFENDGRERNMGESMPRCDFSAEDLVVRVQHDVPGDVNAIPVVVEEIMDVVREQGCAHGEFEIEVSLYEALANAVEHGCGHDPEKSVQIVVACDEEKGMIVIVRDPGPGFDPDSVPSPVVGENIYADSGRGIFLINQLMDEVRFEKNGTEIWMIKGKKSADA